MSTTDFPTQNDVTLVASVVGFELLRLVVTKFPGNDPLATMGACVPSGISTHSRLMSWSSSPPSVTCWVMSWAKIKAARPRITILDSITLIFIVFIGELLTILIVDNGSNVCGGSGNVSNNYTVVREGFQNYTAFGLVVVL